MTTTNWMDRCPYGKTTRMRAIYNALARSGGKPLPLKQVVQRSKVAERTVANMLAAMRSRHHGSSLRRAGVEVAMVDDGFVLKRRKPEPEAKRPASKKQGARG